MQKLSEHHTLIVSVCLLDQIRKYHSAWPESYSVITQTLTVFDFLFVCLSFNRVLESLEFSKWVQP